MKHLRFTAIAATMVAAAPVLAQSYPEGDIDLVVPFDPGGSVDVTSRIIAETANTLLDGATINVVNRAGGGGVVGQTAVSMAQPDGYTVLAMTSSVVTNPQMKGATYAVSDFRPVALYNLDPEVIAVPANSPYQTAEEFLAAAEEQTMNVVVAGIATSHHMSGLAIERVTDIDFNYIPTKGFGGQLQAIAGGHADAALWPMGEAAGQVGAGVRILAVASEERDENFPDVPTFEEAGIDIPIWATFRGWAVPEGTSDEVVQELSDLMQAVYETPAYIEKMEAAGYDPVFRDAASFETVVNSYAEQTSAIIEEAGLGQ
ncbi:tripartite tricarboxylate transporter substrate binding protein [Salipiger sp. IMCC34102]|uniref:tripartite tricarboxylate transporter substrate binding protein n=1 Tax=Salipiger sp. IMCC34102 TaxID=2510647 RepID=UPI00101DC642|nr:tripartite tricarboxylate transporter substrate binding protein [Salipiger sp. IMCC34102]RYH04480.1 tripartite tricarboxylate transporter substrate binding protein [Salipiger sp. IMCC34102]